jgi:hypothetical protein
MTTTDDTITTGQLLWGLQKHGVRISHERLRQLREGYTERKKTKKGMYVKPYPPELIEGVDWIHESEVRFRRSGALKIFSHRYGIPLRDSLWTQMLKQPRNKVDARRRSRKIS